MSKLPDCYVKSSVNKNRGALIGFLVATLIVIWHVIHCFLPLVIPLLGLMDIALPDFFHMIHIPLPVTILSVVWLLYYIFKKWLNFNNVFFKT